MRMSILFVCLIHLGLSNALKILMLDVPSPAIVGESVELTCSYDMEGDKLYSVKWYVYTNETCILPNDVLHFTE